MNRKFIGFLVILLLLSIAAVYVFIPRQLEISSFAVIPCNVNGVTRVLSEDSGWSNKWRGENGYGLRIGGRSFHEIALNIGKGRDTILSQLTILNVGNMDSAGIQWHCSYPSSLNPLERVQQYRQAVGIRHMMDTVLGQIRVFLEKNEHVYGIPMKDSMSTDSILMVTKTRLAGYPTTAEVYKSVAAIRKYIASEGAKETNYPMLHVSKTDSGYECMVAVPTDHQLKGNGFIVPKRYVPWKIMVGEVRGGPYMAEKGMVQLQQYVTDYQKPAMGLPFQSMVTERDREPDTSRWITRVVQAVP